MNIWTVSFILTIILSLPQAFAASGITYHGRILRPDGTPVTGNNVGFYIRVLSDDGTDCPLYEEIQTKNMSTSQGTFAVIIGDGSVAGTYNVMGASVFDQIFENNKTYNFTSPAGCVATPYTALVRAGRKLQVQFRESAGHPWESLPLMTIAHTPFAYSSLIAQKVGQHGSSSILRVENSGTPGAATALTSANMTELMALLGGTTTQYIKSVTGTAGQITASATSGAVSLSLPGVGTAGTYGSATQVPVITTDAQGRITGVVNTTISGTGGGITDLTGDVTATGTGSVAATIANNAVTTVKINNSAVTDTKLASDAVTTVKILDANVTLNKLASDSVNSAKIVDGSIAGSDISGTAALSIASIAATGNVGAGTMTTRSMGLFELPGNGTDSVTLQAPAALAASTTYILPGADGSANQVLQTDGAGNLAWVNQPTVPSTTGMIVDGGNTTGAEIVIGTNDAQKLNFETANATAMTVDATGKVGIGTTAPANKLEIIDTATPLRAFNSSSGTAAIFRARNNANTWPAAGPNSAGITIQNDAAEGGANGRMIGINMGNSISSFIGYIGTRVIDSTNGYGDLIFGTRDATSSAERMRILSSGNVGIGSTSPQTKLEINHANSASGFSNVGNGQLSIVNTDATVGNWGGVSFRDAGLDNPAATVLAKFTDRTNDFGQLHFGTRDVAGMISRMMISESGNVGIGTTAPGAKLDVNGIIRATSFEGPLTATTSSAGNGTAALPSYTFTGDPNTGFYSSGADTIGVSVDGANIFNLSSSGIVSPTTGGAAVSTAAGTAAAPTFSFSGDPDTGWFRAAADTLAAATAGAERMRIDSVGNVGIGTTTPSAKLQVSHTTAVLQDSAVKISPVWTDNSSQVMRALEINPTSATSNSGDSQLIYASYNGNSVFSMARNGHININQNTSSADSGVTVGNNGTGFRVPDGQNLNLNAYFDTTIFYRNTTPRFTVKGSTGNVGIGTTTPSYLTHIKTAAESGDLFAVDADGLIGVKLGIENPGGSINHQLGVIKFEGSNNVGASRGVGGKISSNALNDIYQANNGVLQFEAQSSGATVATSNTYSFNNNGVAQMSIAAGGNVGIGTTAPAEQLEVLGTSANGGRMKITSPSVGTSTSLSAALIIDRYSQKRAGGMVVRGTQIDSSGWFIGSPRIDNAINVPGFGIGYQSGGDGVRTIDSRMYVDVLGNFIFGKTMTTNGLFNDVNPLGASGNVGVLTVVGSGGSAAANGRVQVMNSADLASLAVGHESGRFEFIMRNNAGSANTAYIASKLEGAGGVNGYGGAIEFNTKADNSTSVATRMTIDSAGKVGIGTTAPAANLHTVGTMIAAPQVMIVADEKAAGTEGGTCTAGSWFARTLNTVRTNTITGASLASDTITLPAGTYEIEGYSPGFRTDGFIAKLRNVTDSSDTVIGTTEYSYSGSIQSMTKSHIMGRFTIAASKNFEVQHRCATSFGTYGLGVAYNLGVNTVYTVVKITRVQ